MKKICILLIFICGYSQAQLPPVCLSAATNFTTGPDPFSCVSAHFNADGFKDIAVACSNKISVCLGVGNGSFASAVNYTLPSGSNLTCIVTGDFNLDGNADLAATSYASATIYVWMGNGTGTFSPYISYFLFAFAGPWGLTTADFNGDGKPDLATANVYPNNISILMNTGNGVFAAPVNYPVMGQPISITSADLNNDGKIDLATANYTSSNVSVLMGSSSGTFAAAVNYPAGTSPRCVTSADLNGDNKIDLAVANYGSADISVLLGLGNGSFSATTNYTMTAGGNPRGVTTADFNGDGTLDIASGNWGYQNMGVLLGTGTGSFSAATYFAVGGSEAMIISDDFNNDMKPDVAIPINDYWGSFAVLLNGFNFTVNSGTICAGQSFTINPTGASTYTFSSGNAINTPTANTNYTVTATNTIGCVSSVISSVTVNSLPMINVTTNQSIICNEQTAILTANGANTYSWSTAATTSVISVSPTVTTSYTVYGIDGNGCENFGIITQSVSACTGIASNTIYENTSISIYPNPSKGDITISTTIDMDVLIVNIIGQVVKNISITAPNKHIASISDLPNGIYFITDTKNKNNSQKIVVSK